METISELKQQLKQAQKTEAIGKLAAGVAHEINTPMQFLGDNLSYLTKTFDFLSQHIEKVNSSVHSRGPLTTEQRSTLAKEWQTIQEKEILEQVKEALTDSRDGIKQVSRIVSAMKAFAHPGRFDKTSINVNQSLQTALTVSRNEWKYAAQIEQDLDEDLPFVFGDECDLNQAFLNLIVNAAQAISEKNGDSPGRGKISISTSHDTHYVRVVVSDTGCGIPAELADQVFAPMFTTKKMGEGSGLGLAIVHSIVTQKHHGRISFESEVNRGTRFIVDLPIVVPKAEDSVSGISGLSNPMQD